MYHCDFLPICTFFSPKGQIPVNDILNEIEAPEAENDLHDIPQTELTDIIIDCTTMGYVDSVGVSTLSQVVYRTRSLLQTSPQLNVFILPVSFASLPL